MRKNKKTATWTGNELSPLTRRILAQMGPEGQAIQSRLKKFISDLASAHFKMAEDANRSGSNY